MGSLAIEALAGQPGEAILALGLLEPLAVRTLIRSARHRDKSVQNVP